MSDRRGELVVDASVAIKWVVDEPGSDAAQELLDDHLSDTTPLLAPEHLVGEVGNGLRKLVGRGLIDRRDAMAALGDLVDLEIGFLDSVAVWPRTLEAALEWQLTTYDAVYVLTALDRQTELVTADRRLQQTCAERDLPVRLLAG